MVGRGLCKEPHLHRGRPKTTSPQLHICPGENSNKDFEPTTKLDIREEVTKASNTAIDESSKASSLEI